VPARARSAADARTAPSHTEPLAAATGGSCKGNWRFFLVILGILDIFGFFITLVILRFVS
jgi:hypothetical protein